MMRCVFLSGFEQSADTLTRLIQASRERKEGLTEDEVGRFSQEIEILNEVLMAQSLGISVQELKQMPELHFKMYRSYWLRGLANG